MLKHQHRLVRQKERLNITSELLTEHWWTMTFGLFQIQGWTNSFWKTNIFFEQEHWFDQWQSDWLWWKNHLKWLKRKPTTTMDCRTLPRPARLGRLFTTDKDGASFDQWTFDSGVQTNDFWFTCFVLCFNIITAAYCKWLLDHWLWNINLSLNCGFVFEREADLRWACLYNRIWWTLTAKLFHISWQ